MPDHCTPHVFYCLLCAVNIKTMYKRKTKEKYFIGHKYGFDGKEQIMTWDLKDESECNQKLKDLWRKVEESRRNPILDPFSQFERWWKITKRVPI